MADVIQRSESPDERTAIRPHTSNQEQFEEVPSTAFCCRWLWPRRYLVAVMAFFGFCNVYALRVNLSVAIVSMTSNRTVINENGVPVVVPPEFDWDSELQGMVLSSFFYGYIVTQIPGGYLAAHYGGRRIFGIGVAVTSVLTILTPIFARTNLYLLLAARLVEGLFEGVTYPAIHALWSRWAPPLERTKLATIAFSGSYFGTVIALPVSGFLADTIGWAFIFVFFGLIAFVWVIVWSLVVAETPQLDKNISEEELDYIRSTVGSSCNHVKNLPIPWKKMLTSLPLWAIIIAHFSENWGFYTLLTELPTYMNDMFKYDLYKAGLLSALPYLAMGFIVQIGGFLADWLRANGSLTTTKVRKLFNCAGFLFQTVFLMLASHVSSPALVILFLTLAVGFGGFAWAGFSVNHLDLAPQYASIMMGISNTVATLPGMISPILTGHVVQHKTPEEWQIVFYIASGVYLVGALFYALCASGEEQRWAHVTTGLLADDESGRHEDVPFGGGSSE